MKMDKKHIARFLTAEIKMTETDIFAEILQLFKETIDMLPKDKQDTIMDKLNKIMDKERTTRL